MKRIFTIILMALSLLWVPMAQAQTYWDGTQNKSWTGTGTADDPILISTAEQLAGFADSVNRGDDFSGRYIELAADIYLNDSTLADSLKLEWEHPIGQFLNGGSDWEYTLDTAWFRGNFDGKNHIIYNLFYGTTPESPDWDDPDNPLGGMGGPDFSGWAKALFGFVENATIKNVRLENAVLNGASSIATLALQVKGNSVIENCHATGVVMNIDPEYGGPAGGLIARLISGQVLNCSADVDAYASRGAGGLIGYVATDGIVRDCSASGATHCVEYYAGGLVGLNSGLIENSHASGRVSRAYYKHAYMDCGGFVGTNGEKGIIRNCSAKGEVHMYGNDGGGFVGWNTGHIESCYAAGNVYDEGDGYGSSASAFCAMNGRDSGSVYENDASGTLINCFATGKTVTMKQHHLMGYPAGRPSRGFLSSYGVRLAKIVNCSYCQVRPDTLMGILGGVEELPETYMKSQAFVDTLNMFAAIHGISTWEYRAGDYPVPTGVNATNITDYLAGGSGTKEDPFLIATKQHLENFREMVNHGEHFEGKYIRQTADIALNAPRDQWGIQMPEQWTAIGTMKLVTCYEPHYIVERSHTYHFRGTYDGGFHKIENMYIDDPAGRPAGLFGILYHNAVIKNLSVTDAYVISPGTHAGVAILASDVDRYANNVYISQCHTSGLVGDPENILGLGTASAIVNGIALEGDNWILNCSSSADVYAYGTPSAVTHQGGIGGTDTIGNFLFTGTLTKRGVTSYDRCMIPNQQDSWIVSQNGYFDSDKYQWNTNAQATYNNLGRPTAYLQSVEFANVLNDYVDNWNATHVYKLDYWQVQEGDYPRVNPDYKPNLVVTFESNGGTAIATKRVSENSHILMPAKPTKDGYIFAGWYEDAAFTKVFDFDSTAVTQSMTLYAKWLEPTYDEYDYSIFNNKFATEFHITNKAQLLGFVHAVNGIDGVLTPNNFKGKTVYLDCDILLNDTTDWEYWGRYTYAEPWIPIGTGSLYMYPIHPFLGTFDGQGHVISGLYIDGEYNATNLSDHYEDGLFGYVGTSGETTVIRNLGIQASVADMRGNRIESDMGLLAGVLRDGTITQCFTQGKIVVDSKSVEVIGGFVGHLGGINYDAGGVVTDCYSQVDIVYNPMDINATVRGLFGSGLVDWNNGSISNSYVAGGSWQEGVAGGTISNIYYNKELSPNASAKTGTGLTSNEMHAKSSFSGFDFETIWGRNDTINNGYPYLRCFYEEKIPDSPDPVKVTGIDFTEAGQTIKIIADQPLQLHASVLPTNAADQRIVWAITSGQTYATVDEKGVVNAPYQANKAGQTQTVVLTATTYEGNFQKKCSVQVYYPNLTIHRKPIANRLVGDTKWVNNGSNSQTSVNREYMMAIYVKPDSLHQPVTITNSNPDVASFTILTQDTVLYENIPDPTLSVMRCAIGIMTGLKAGETTITATHPSGYTYSLTRKVAVSNITSMQIQASSTSLKVGDTLQLSVTSNPVDASYPLDGLTWSSSDENILKVDHNGRLIALGEGSATITLTSSQPALTTTKSFTISHIHPSRIEILSSDEDAEIYEGDTCTLTAIISPENTTMRDIEWVLRTPGDTTYVKLIPMGDSCKAIGLKESGRIYIQAKSLGSSGRYGEYGLRINEKVLLTSLSFRQTTVSMTKGESKRISVAAYPYSFTENIIWTSSDENVVVIEEQFGNKDYCTLNALAAGKATITATAKESGLTATCEVTVVDPSIPRDPITVRLDPRSCTTWSTVYLYAWDANKQQLTGGWPGTKVSKDSVGWWSHTFDGQITNVNIIWTNGDGAQTADITNVTTSTCYKLNSTSGNNITTTVLDCSTNVQPVYFTVTFKDWNGVVLKTEQVEQGKSATAPAAPTREGYTFKGWDKDFSNVQSDLTVTAQYDKNIVYFTVTFKDWNGTVLKTEQVEQGKSATAPATPTREGYTFKGWDKDLSNVQSNLTVTAVYEQNVVADPITVRLDPRSCESWAIVYLYAWDTDQQQLAGGWPGTIVTKDSEGWWSYTFDSKLRNVNIIWTDGNGAQTADITNVIASTCYKLNTQSGNKIQATVVDCQEEVTPVYFTVIFQDWNGTVLKTEQVEQGKSATAPANPTREGYTFTGWNKDFSNVQSDLTITAQYKKNITYFTVTFQDWNGTVLKTEQVEQGHGATAPADPTRKGYTFIGWDKAFNNVQSDLIVKAQYEQQIVESITVRLDPSSVPSWKNVYLYAWDAKQTPIAGAWPGTKVSKDADGWWSYTFATDIAMVNIIWNNGSGAQTVDIENVTTSTCYQLNATTGVSITATVVECRPLTALEDAETDSTPQLRKVMIDNKLYILMPDGTMYDSLGRKVR